MALLAAYRWPGNVRQLENAVFRAVVLAEGDEIGVAEFPQIAARGLPPLAPPSAPLDVPVEVDTAPALAESALPEPGRIAPQHGVLPLLDSLGEVRTLDEIESDVIRFAIAHYRGQMSEVARRLQIGRSTLYRKLDSLGLAGEDSAESGPEGVVSG